MAPKALAAVLWDLDGTLIDSQPVWIRSQARLVAEHGGEWTYADGLTLVGVNMDDVARAMQRAGVHLNATEIIQRLTQDVTASLTLEVPWRPGAFELVEALFDAGIPQAIVTSSPLFVPQLVADALPGDAIQAIVADEHVRNSKPDPEPYLTATSALGVPPDRCIALEDSPAGLAAAIAAGTAAVGVPRDAALDPSSSWVLLDSLVGVRIDDLVRILDRRHLEAEPGAGGGRTTSMPSITFGTGRVDAGQQLVQSPSKDA